MSSSSDEEAHDDGSSQTMLFRNPSGPSDPSLDPGGYSNASASGGESKKKAKMKAAVPNGTEANGEKPKEDEIDPSKLDIKFVDQT